MQDSEIPQPTLAQFETLLRELVAAKDTWDSGDRSILACAHSLAAVIAFIDAEQRIADLGVTAPLGTLLAALNDLYQGAKPKLLDVPKRLGRPTNLAHHGPKGVLAACITILMKSGAKRTEAAVIVANEIRNGGLKVKGFSRAAVLRWRHSAVVKAKDHSGAEKSEISATAYENTLRQRASGRQPKDVNEAKLLVRAYIEQLKMSGFLD